MDKFARALGLGLLFGGSMVAMVLVTIVPLITIAEYFPLHESWTGIILVIMWALFMLTSAFTIAFYLDNK